MGEDSIVYVGVDVSKNKHAIAVAEGGRTGEVRYFGEIETTPASVERLVRKLEKEVRAPARLLRSGPRRAMACIGRSPLWGTSARSSHPR